MKTDRQLWKSGAYYFGVCPKCKEEPHFVNVNRVHFAHCTLCGTAWEVGSNLFSSWRNETRDLWEKNLKMLEEHYTLVEPYHPKAPWEAKFYKYFHTVRLAINELGRAIIGKEPVVPF